MKIMLYGNESTFRLEDMTDEEFYQFMDNHPNPELMGNVLYDKIKQGVKKIKEKIKKAVDTAKKRHSELPTWAKIVTPLSETVSNIPVPVPTIPEIQTFQQQLRMTPSRAPAPVLKQVITKPAEMTAPKITLPSQKTDTPIEEAVYVPDIEEKKEIPGWVWLGLATIPFLL